MPIYEIESATAGAPLTEAAVQSYLHAIRRVLLVGAPNSWKTSSLWTWADTTDPEEYVHIISLPGEKGYSSIPQHPQVRAYRMSLDDPDNEVALTKAFTEVVALINVILDGKRGRSGTIILDGLHKLYAEVIYPMVWKEAGGGAKEAGRAYGAAHTKFREILNRCQRAKRFVATVWDKDKREDPDNQRSQLQTWSALPGDMARAVTGEFSCVFYAEPGRHMGGGKFSQGTWQTRPTTDIPTPSMKIPLQLASTAQEVIPTKIAQDWMAFERQYELMLRGQKPTADALKPKVNAA